MTKNRFQVSGFGCQGAEAFEFGRGKVEDRKKLNIEHRTSNIESSKGGQVLNGKR